MTSIKVSRRCGWALTVLGVVSVVHGSAAPQKKRQPQVLIAGTVFGPGGRSVPGASVIVVNEAEPKRKVKGRSDRRGEFAIRLPAGKARYRVTASAKGLEPQEKTVDVYDHEKVTVTFLLDPE